jgi:hypothetical protein
MKNQTPVGRGLAQQGDSLEPVPCTSGPRENQPHRMRLISFKPLVKGSLRGFASVELPIGLTILDIPIFASNTGKASAAMPGKPVLGADGRQIEVDGKRQYATILEWRSSELAKQFSAAVVKLVEEALAGTHCGPQAKIEGQKNGIREFGAPPRPGRRATALGSSRRELPNGLSREGRAVSSRSRASIGNAERPR